MIETDFIISLGPACRIAHYLREHNLRHVANPLDWMMNYSLESAMQWFKNVFEDFFLEIEENPNNEANGYRWIIDTNSGAVSIHHFPVNVTLKHNHEKFMKIMRKRSYRMDKIIKRSDKILFISNRNQPKRDFYRFLEEFQELYDKNCLFINIKDIKTSFDKYTKILNSNLKFIEYKFHDVHINGPNKEDNPNFWIGNEERWNEIMNNIRLTSKFNSKSKRIDGKIIR